MANLLVSFVLHVLFLFYDNLIFVTCTVLQLCPYNFDCKMSLLFFLIKFAELLIYERVQMKQLYLKLFYLN